MTQTVAVSADPTLCLTFLQRYFAWAPENKFFHLFGQNKRGEGGKAYWYRVKDLGKAAGDVADLSQEWRSVYFSPALTDEAHETYQRIKAGVREATALCGLHSDSDRLSPVHAKTALPGTIEEACSLFGAAGLRPTFVVDTGYGVQGHWQLREPWTFEESAERSQAQALLEAWQGTLKAHAQRRGWDCIDSTADLARVQRLPGSLNRKQDEGRLVTILDSGGPLYSPSDFEPWLQQPMQPEQSKKREDAYDGPPGDVGPILAGCAWLRHCRDDAKTLPEPDWYGAATILAGCTDGQKTFREWSRPYAGYTEAETEKKFKHAQNDSGPLKCSTIRNHHGGGPYCQECAFSGLVVSPISLGIPKQTRTWGTGTNGNGNGTHPPQDAAPGSGIQDEAAAVLVKFEPNDSGNGRRLVHRYGADLRFSPQYGWVIYDGRRWAKNEPEAVRRAKATARAIILEAALIKDTEAQEKRFKWAVASGSGTRLREMLWSAQSEPGITIEPGLLDADPWLLTCLNGTLDLRTGELRPHRREDLITKLCPVEYDAEARSDTWEKLLSFATHEDAELIAFLQRAAGYTLTGDTREEKLFFIHGPTQTGKSTFVEAIKSTLGEYATTADFEAFLARPTVGTARNDIARLAAARLVASIEVDEGKRLAEGLVKMLTGGDVVTARFLYKEAFEFLPQFKLWLCANHAPRVRDDDDAIWRRILRVPFERTVPEDQRDPNVKATLRNPAISGPAILAWMVRGCLEWQEVGLGIPPVVRQSTDAYREEQDPLKDFLEECCVLRVNAWAATATLRSAYERWADDNHTRQLTWREVTDRLTGRGCSQVREMKEGQYVRGWRGIGVLDENRQAPQTKQTPPDTGLSKSPPITPMKEELLENASGLSVVSESENSEPFCPHCGSQTFAGYCPCQVEDEPNPVPGAFR